MYNKKPGRFSAGFLVFVIVSCNVKDCVSRYLPSVSIALRMAASLWLMIG